MSGLAQATVCLNVVLTLIVFKIVYETINAAIHSRSSGIFLLFVLAYSGHILQASSHSVL